MNVLIMSKKYSPAHMALILGYQSILSQLGHDTKLFLDEQYKDFVKSNNISSNIVYEIAKDEKFDLVIIINLSTVDSKYVKILKKNNKNCKILFINHEPWCGYKKFLKIFFKREEDLKECIKIYGRKIYSSRLIKKVDGILVCSKNAYNITKRIYKKKVFYFPLVFNDSLNKKIELDDKKYFSFVGTATVAHGIEDYLNFVKWCYKQNIDLKFKIATKTNINQFLDDELLKLIEKKYLIVQSGRVLTEDEINDSYLETKVLWMCYRRSTQSGCLCKAFMHGTPVLATNVGSFNEFVTFKNGYILEQMNFEEVYKGYLKIIENLPEIVLNARNSYFEFFDAQYNKDNFKYILEQIDFSR